MFSSSYRNSTLKGWSPTEAAYVKYSAALERIVISFFFAMATITYKAKIIETADENKSWNRTTPAPILKNRKSGP